MIFPRSNAKTLDNIRPRKQNRNPNIAIRRRVLGIDTETDRMEISFLSVIQMEIS